MVLNGRNSLISSNELYSPSLIFSSPAELGKALLSIAIEAKSILVPESQSPLLNVKDRRFS
jgi:hypothetical protein